MGNINDYGFPFTSSNGDRAYTAADFRAFYELLFTTGLAYGALNSLEVVQQDTPDMSVLVKSGAVMIRGAMRVVETAETLEPNTNPAGSDRIDYVVARLVYATRRIDLALVQGVAGSGAPALTRNDSIYELAMAKLTLPSGYAAVTTAMITDTREDGALCGYLGFTTLRAGAIIADSLDTGSGAMSFDQGVKKADSPTFADATIASKLLSTYLGYLGQDVKTTAAPTFAGIDTGFGQTDVHPISCIYGATPVSGGLDLPPMTVGEILLYHAWGNSGSLAIQIRTVAEGYGTYYVYANTGTMGRIIATTNNQNIANVTGHYSAVVIRVA